MGNWIMRIIQDREKLDENARLKILRATLMYTPPFLTGSEIETFLAPQDSLSNLDVLIAFSDIEKKVGDSYASGGFDERWEREKYVQELKEVLSGIYSETELEELTGLLIRSGDVSALTINLVGGHYGMRRIRNSYLPRITDFIEVNQETGVSKDLTKDLFKEGPEDAVARIDRILGIKEVD